MSVSRARLRGYPFEEHVWLELTTTRHRIIGLLSSRLLGLQRARPIASTLSVRCSRRGLFQTFAVFTMERGVTISLVPPDARALGSRSEYVPSRLVTVPLQSTVVRFPTLQFARAGVMTALPWSLSYLSATSEAGSDLHRAYLPRLCCVLRLSQPLDALFRPHPFDLVSCRYHPGFRLQRIPLRDSLVRLTTPFVPLAVCRSDRMIASSQLQGLMHSRSPCHPPRCYPEIGGRASPDVHPFEVFLSRSRRPCGCLLSWASTRRRSLAETTVRRRACSAEFQRAEE
jgi:hypothetical protein